MTQIFSTFDRPLQALFVTHNGKPLSREEFHACRDKKQVEALRQVRNNNKNCTTKRLRLLENRSSYSSKLFSFSLHFSPWLTSLLASSNIEAEKKRRLGRKRGVGKNGLEVLRLGRRALFGFVLFSCFLTFECCHCYRKFPSIVNNLMSIIESLKKVVDIEWRFGEGVVINGKGDLVERMCKIV